MLAEERPLKSENGVKSLWAWSRKKNPGKEKGLSLWPQPKNRIQANLALWLQAGRARESGRQIIWSSNPGLSSNFLCLCYSEEQNDTSMGQRQGREEGRGRKGWVERLWEWGMKEWSRLKEHERHNVGDWRNKNRKGRGEKKRWMKMEVMDLLQ